MRGVLRTNEDFVVREVIEDKFLRKFVRTKSGVSRVDGPYSLYIMKKSGENTRDAIRKISGKTGISDIGYAGLKDRNAVTYQYITVKNASFRDMDIGNVHLSFMSKTRNHISVGDLIGNNFEITLHGCTEIEKIEEISGIMKEKGFPNFFGRQRFGVNMDNYLIGRCVVRRDFSGAGKLVAGQGKSFSKVGMKFFIHSYQSWIFNCALRECIRTGKVPETLPLVGYGSRITNDIMKGFVEKEGVRPEDFRISELGMCCTGSERATYVRTDMKYSISRDKVLLKFFLPKGSYATVLLEEMKKM